MTTTRSSAHHSPATVHSGGLRATGLAGVLGPVLFTGAFVLQNVLRSDDDWVAEPVSALAAGDAGWVQGTSFVVFGVLLATLALGLHRGIRPGHLGVLGPALLLVAAAGLGLAAAFPISRDGEGELVVPVLHQVSGPTVFLGCALALLALAPRLSMDARWSDLAPWARRFGLTGLAGVLVIVAATWSDDAPLHDWFGLVQRTVLVIAILPMVVVLGWRLRHVR